LCYKISDARNQWLTPVILATQETEIRRIMVQCKPGQKVRDPISKKHPKRAGRVAESEGPEFKP
jgi:hypothetical protein